MVADSATGRIPTPRSTSQRTVAGILALFVVIFSALEIAAFTRTSATWDEPTHLTAGYAALAHGDYRVDPEHPPFLRMWAALPLLLMPSVALDTTTIDRVEPGQWATSALFTYTHDVVYRQNDADRLIYAARGMMVVWGLLLGILVFCWVYEWLGLAAAALALTFYTLEPNIHAHAGLVTTDLGATCFVFGAIYFLWRTTRVSNLKNVVGVTTFTVLAALSKFSALLLAPIVVVLLIVASRHRLGARSAIVLVLTIAIASVAATWAIYRFSYLPSATPDWRYRLQETELLGGRAVRDRVPLTTHLVTWIDDRALLPNVLTQGFLLGQAKATSRATFLAGNYSNEGWWYYFPVAILLKTPTVLLTLFGVGIAVFAMQWRAYGSTNLCFIAVPWLVWGAAAVSSNLNLGVRHVLPMYPFMLVIAAVAGAWLLRHGRLGRATLTIALVGWLGEFVAAYPHTLAFFNQVAGGPALGFEYLSDSNVDWGQDLKPLKAWMDRQGVSTINLAYFGTADPEYYRMNVVHLPGSPFFAPSVSVRPKPGYVAISVSILNGSNVETDWRPFYTSFRNRTPVADIGHSIHVYRVDDQWPSAVTDFPVNPSQAELSELHRLAGAMARVGWTEAALARYRLVSRFRPSDVGVLSDLAIAQVAAGRLTEGIATLQQAVVIAPADGATRLNLAIALLDANDPRAALNHAREAARLRSTDPIAHALFGHLLFLAGSSAEARVELEHALRLDPNNSIALSDLAQLPR